MSDIPSEVFREILVRLPAVSLFRFRSVCKTWQSMIDDPSFIRTHANNQVCSHTILVRNQTGSPIYFFSLDSLKFKRGPQRIEATRIKQLIRPGVPRLPNLSQVASCNGLLLLSSENVKRIWAIWNPLNGEYHELPQPNATLNKNDFGLGFGYDCDADDYKVVRIDRLSSAENVVYQTLVYSLKSGSWSIIEGCPESHFLSKPGVFLNGKLYWISFDGVFAFDLCTKSFFQFPLPPKPNKVEMDTPSCDLVALDGCLIFSMSYRFQYGYTIVEDDGWMMKDDGVEKIWIKLFSIRYPIGSLLLHDSWESKIVAYLKSKRQIVLQDYRGFLWFDIDKKFGEPYSTQCSWQYWSCYSYKHSNKEEKEGG